MSIIKIAFPTNGDLGLADELSEHFGHSSSFTVVSWNDDEKSVEGVDILPNQAHEQGGCMMPVMMLKNQRVDVVVLGGIGMRPLAAFWEQGVSAYHGTSGTVKDNLDMYVAGKLSQMTESTCSHH